ncbi:hypothetical protein R1sor_019057 [Riccia sorocarpa]|uniref:Uncharacterized protein n=1 Tax=Riccia sorocarpa TaxID=122646 RepID=A0ABD3IF21_9MARC
MAAQAEAPLHFDLYTEDDDVNYIRWKWIPKKEAHRVLSGIDPKLLKRSGLHDALWMDWTRPEVSCTTFVREFVLNWDDRIQSSTVGGWEVPLTIDTVREYFLLPEGKTAPRPCRRGRRFGLGYICEEKIREEIRAYKKQMQASGKRKVRPTCIGIVVLHILKTCGIVEDEDIVLNDYDKSVEEVTLPRSAEAPPVQASPTKPDRQHSHESSLGAPSTLSDHAICSGSDTTPDRESTGPFDNESLIGFGSPMVPYPLLMTRKKWPLQAVHPWVHQSAQQQRRVSGHGA